MMKPKTRPLKTLAATACVLICAPLSAQAASIVGPFPSDIRYNYYDRNQDGTPDCSMIFDIKVRGAFNDANMKDYFAYEFVDDQDVRSDEAGSNGTSAYSPGFDPTRMVSAVFGQDSSVSASITFEKGAVIAFPIEFKIYEALPSGNSSTPGLPLASYEITRSDFYAGFKASCPGFFVDSPPLTASDPVKVKTPKVRFPSPIKR